MPRFRVPITTRTTEYYIVTAPSAEEAMKQAENNTMGPDTVFDGEVDGEVEIYYPDIQEVD